MTRVRTRGEREGTDAGTAEEPAPRNADLPMLGGVVVSTLLVPLSIYYLLPVQGAGGDAPVLLAVGGLAMVPGFLMGAVGLWTAARG